MPAEARHVVAHAAPTGEAAVLDGQRAIDVDGLATVGDEQGEQAVAEGGIVARVVVAPGAPAGAAEAGAVVVVGESVTAGAACAAWLGTPNR